MIVSGWISSLSTDTSVVFGDYVAETAQPDGSGTDVLGVIALSLFQQGEGGSVAGDATAYIRAYGSSSQPYVDVPGDPANNAYYVYGSTFVLFRLTVEFAYAYAHAMTIPLGGLETQARIVHRNFMLHTADGRHLSQVRFGLRAEHSRLDVASILRHSAGHVAAHHKLPPEDVLTREVGADAIGFTPPRRKVLP
jgi:hypothetical protein